MREVLLKVDEIIKQYNESNNFSPTELSDMMRQLSTNLYFLESHRVNYYKLFHEQVRTLKNQGWSINAAENEAEVKIPELYELRRKMTQANKVFEGMRSHLSQLKIEMQNTDLHV